jgi:hypothetical protein
VDTKSPSWGKVEVVRRANFIKKLSQLEYDAKIIVRIQKITNTIIANTCYHEKELEKQIERGQNLGNLTTEERDLLTRAWNYRKKKAKICLTS